MIDVTGFKAGAGVLTNPLVIETLESIERESSAYRNVVVTDAKLFFDGECAVVSFYRDSVFARGQMMREKRVQVRGPESGSGVIVSTEVYEVPVEEESHDED